MQVTVLAAAALALAPGPFQPRTNLIVPGRVAGVAIGMAQRAVTTEWGRPLRTSRPPTGKVYLDWGAESDLWFAQVELTHGRATRVVVSLRSTRLHTRFGDRFGTTASVFRRHWPGARRHLGCCAPGFIYAVPSSRGYFLAFHFVKSRLDRVELLSPRELRCYEVECA